MKRTLFLLSALILSIGTWTLAQPGAASSWADAQWVWDEADANKVAQNNEPRYLRLSFNLSATPQSAELWVTADNLYIAYVNGVKVGDGKEWSQVDKYNVAKHLREGKNVLAIKATNAGGVAGAIARLHIKTADKKDLFIVTNDKTKIHRGATVSERWFSVGFDDSGWFNAIALGDPTIAPWNVSGGAAVKGKGKKGGGQFGYDTNETVPVKGRLTPQEQIKHFVVPKDFEIELVAADPLVINPITMVMDDKGRIIVSESHTYRYGPKGSPIKPYANPVIRLDPEGKGGFTRTLVADGFVDPVMGIAVKGNKLWLTACDYLYTYDLPEAVDKPGAKGKPGDVPPLAEKDRERSLKFLKIAADMKLPYKDRREAIAEIAEHPDLVEPLLKLLPADYEVITSDVIAVLVKIGSPKALPVLSKLGEGVAISGKLNTIRIWAIEQIQKKQKEVPQKQAGIATNKKLLLKDHSKAWNPFGMFVLEWGPDGKLYMSVGNHNINIEGPDGKISSKGGSGLVMRMNPDGTKMERLVHGLRVPYSFEMDPFGQLWLLSNGEGNPNRIVRVIDGVDYHCYSRGAVDNNWLAGKHPLAPPSEELHRGAHTQLMRYYAAAYPKEYQGNLFLCNWGAHGYAGPNRGIFRFVTDERNNIVQREPLVWCKDPHFRPAHIILDQDGSLLIADWYGRDDESDMTGRIWRLKYVGKNAPVVKHKLDSPEWKNDDYAIDALGSPHHLIREKAMTEVVKRGQSKSHKDQILRKLDTYVSGSKESLGAATAMWTALKIDKSNNCFAYGATNSDWKVRRLAVILFNLYSVDKPLRLIDTRDKDEAVNLQMAIGHTEQWATNAIRFTLKKGAAPDRHLRYEAAWHFAKHGDQEAIAELLSDNDADVRLAGLIAIDIACYENLPSKKAALAALGKALENPGKLDQQLLLDVARLNGDASIVPGLEKLIARDDVPTATVAKAFLVLKAKAGPGYALKAQGAGKRFIEAVEKGQLKIATTADQLVMFEFLESEGPTPFALKQVGGQLQSPNKELRLAAHTLARRFGPKASALGDGLWPSVLSPKSKFEDAIESLSTIARTESAPKGSEWEKTLEHGDPFVRAEAVRWWRKFKDQPTMMQVLRYSIPDLIKKDERIKEDLAAVYNEVKLQPDKAWMLPAQETNKDALSKYALDELAKMPAADRPKRAAMGLQVFERHSCTKCHTTATATTLLAPSLKGVAGQKLDYLIESVLHPSKIIKTGWEVEVIETKKGKTLTGLVKDDGKFLRVLALDKDERVLKSDVESRSVSKVSVMPEGQEAALSRREFVDLICYLQTLK